MQCALKQDEFSQLFPAVPFVILITFSLCDGKSYRELQFGEGGFSLNSVQTHNYLVCLTLWGQSPLTDFTGTKRVLIFKDFNLVFRLLVTSGGVVGTDGC